MYYFAYTMSNTPSHVTLSMSLLDGSLSPVGTLNPSEGLDQLAPSPSTSLGKSVPTGLLSSTLSPNQPPLNASLKPSPDNSYMALQAQVGALWYEICVKEPKLWHVLLNRVRGGVPNRYDAKVIEILHDENLTVCPTIDEGFTLFMKLETGLWLLKTMTDIQTNWDDLLPILLDKPEHEYGQFMQKAQEILHK